MGHASSEEQAEIERLESIVDLAASPLEDLLELAQLYLEPSHREDEAIALLEAVLARDPASAPARFWLASTLLHHLMDEASLLRGARLLEPVANGDGPYAGAAVMLLAEILDDLGELAPETRIDLLETSVAREPSWVFNRQSLAWAYRDAGRPQEAREQLRQAVANVVEPEPDWDSVRRHFEEAVSGRTGHRARERLMADLEATPPGGEPGSAGG